MQFNIEILRNYVPDESLPILEKWFVQRPFDLKITKKRATKFGDFRGSTDKQLDKISVNSNLNPYAFLITLTHEFAHLLVWQKHKHKAKAHGSEWKNEFSILLTVLITKNIFPTHLASVLKNHLKKPPASSARDINLINELKKYDTPSNAVHLLELPEGSIFRLNNKKSFIKGKKRRTRYLCKEITTHKEYLIHGIAEVELANIVDN